MKMKEFSMWLDETTSAMTDLELCACFEFYLEQAELELQTAEFQDEWHEYETLN